MTSISPLLCPEGFRESNHLSLPPPIPLIFLLSTNSGYHWHSAEPRRLTNVLFFPQDAHYFMKCNLYNGCLLQMVLSYLLLFSYSLAKRRYDLDSSVDCFHEAATSSKNDKMCCSLRERRENNTSSDNGTIQMAFQRRSLISQYPPPDIIQSISLKHVINLYSMWLVKTFLKVVWHQFTF